MLGEIRLELPKTGARPVLDPGLGDVVLDPVQTPFAHLIRMIDTNPDNGYGPFGSTSRPDGPKRFVERS